MLNEDQLLQNAGIKPTAARELILRTLAESHRPLSMGEIADTLETVDVSVISRSLTLFREHHLIHVIEDGSDSTRYELCHHTEEQGDDDIHVHFHCEKCGKTYCLENLPVPAVLLPDGFEAGFVNYMIKGLCPDCSHKPSK
ncbi:MAG: Fur family transcriptional regulator [Candidatus Cryptobacteroides sp.]